MISANIKIKNADQIAKAFKKAPSLMSKEFDKAIAKSGYTIMRSSMIATPVDTGFLRASHRFRQIKTGFRLGYGEIKVNAEYARYVHDGTRFIKGRPFLREAVESNEAKVTAFFIVAVNNALNKIGRMT